jgi:thymidylate synthase
MNIEKQYLRLLDTIVKGGALKDDRTGTGTISYFGAMLRHDMSLGFPLLTTKKMYWKGVVAELLWFLSGSSDIRDLLHNNCHIWDGDAYKRFQSKHSNISKGDFITRLMGDDKFAEEWANLGPIYGPQWRYWGGHFDKEPSGWHHGAPVDFKLTPKFDQINNAIDMLRMNPDSRRIIVNAWNVTSLDKMVLPPCHYSFQFYSREATPKEQYIWLQDNPDKVAPNRVLSLIFNMRSNDVPLGLPFNIASYALLLEIMSRMVNMIPSELVVSIADAHIYTNQLEGVKEQMTREPYPLAKLDMGEEMNFEEGIDEFLSSCSVKDFRLVGYESHPAIKMPLSN